MGKEEKKIKFINKAIAKYSKKYDYSLVDYVNSQTKVKITCSKHGVIFEQVPSEHLRGREGCKACSGKSIVNTYSFIFESKKKHGDRYNYSKSKYVDSKTKVSIICLEHGRFEQLPSNHASGQGCPKCKGLSITEKKTMTTDEFICKSIKTHGEKYDYSLVNYVKSTDKVRIICREHGEFKQQPVSHIRGKGCIECGIEKNRVNLVKTKEEFISDSIGCHGDKYNYSLVKYINSHTKVKILCPEHGEFEQLPYDHIANHGCTKCTSSISKEETEINDFLNSIGVETIPSSMSIIKPYQLDIYIPSNKIAIEYNGLYWHNEERVDNNYHLKKTELCEEKDIQLIHIFEDEWINRKDIVKSRLRNILGLTNEVIYARKCEIKEVAPSDSRKFLDDNHLQGSINASIKLGLYHNEELVSLMLFNKPRAGIGSHYDGFELSRFCNKINLSVVGGASRLLKHFIKTYEPKEIISYADKRWSQGGLYEKLGFNLTHTNKPNYWYIVGKKREHRFKYRKDKLVSEGFDKNLTEHQIMINRGIYRIYDCGTITYKKTF